MPVSSSTQSLSRLFNEQYRINLLFDETLLTITRAEIKNTTEYSPASS